MAFRTWAKLLGVTLGVAALAGACQLGLAYGLGILRLARVLEVAVRDQWTAQLAWVAWFAMSAAVVGALAGRWLGLRWQAPATIGRFAALALASGVGAALVVPLTMQPARTARIDGVHPVFVIGLCAALGVAAGIFAAYAVLTQAIARWSLTTTGIVIWVLALGSVAPSLAPEDPLPAVRLGVFDAGFLSAELVQRSALFTMPALALVIGLLLGYRARRRNLPTLTIALAGLPGPALLTLSYLIAGPGAGADRYQVVPYWAAMTATGAGVLGSVLAAVIRRDGDLEDAEPGTETITMPAAKEPARGGAPAGVPKEAPQATAPREAPDAAAPREAPQAGAPRAAPPAGVPKEEPQAAAPKPAPRPNPAPDQTGPAPDQTGPASDQPQAGRAPKRARAKSAPRQPKPAPSDWTPQGAEAGGAEMPAATAAPAARKAPKLPRRSRGAGPTPADHNTGELPTFNAFATPSKGRPRPPKEAAPYVPAPALPEIPPEALQPKNVDARPGKLHGIPLVPEPHQLSKPLPNPEPVTPPLPVTPAPDKSRNRKRDNDDEYVDWVSRLGNE